MPFLLPGRGGPSRRTPSRKPNASRQTDTGPTFVPVTLTQGENVWVVQIGTDPLPYAFAAEDDIFPQTFKPEEDYWFQLAPDPVSIAIVEWPGRGADGPTPAPPIQDEDYDLKLPLQPRVFTPWLFATTDEWVAPPATAQLDDGYCHPLYSDPVSIAVVEWPGRGAGGPTPAAGSTVVFEDYDFRLRSYPQAVSFKIFSVEDEIVPAITQSGGGRGWGAFSRKREETTWQAWEFQDEIGTPPTPGTYEDDSWQVYVPPLLAKSFAYLPDPEELTFIVPIPGTYEDDSWIVNTPFLLMAPKFVIYLPDGENLWGPPPVPSPVGTQTNPFISSVSRMMGRP